MRHEFQKNNRRIPKYDWYSFTTKNSNLSRLAVAILPGQTGTKVCSINSSSRHAQSNFRNQTKVGDRSRPLKIRRWILKCLATMFVYIFLHFPCWFIQMKFSFSVVVNANVYLFICFCKQMLGYDEDTHFKGAKINARQFTKHKHSYFFYYFRTFGFVLDLFPAASSSVCNNTYAYQTGITHIILILRCVE
jgi:hypothetical protein